MSQYKPPKIKSVDLLFDFRTPALPRRWRHFCVVYKEEGQSATVYQVIDGNEDKDDNRTVPCEKYIFSRPFCN